MIYATLFICALVIFITVFMQKSKYSLAFILLFSGITLFMVTSIFSYMAFSNYKYVSNLEIYIFNYISKIKISYYELKILSIISMVIIIIGFYIIGYASIYYPVRPVQKIIRIFLLSFSICLFIIINSNWFCENLFLWQYSSDAVNVQTAHYLSAFVKIYDILILPIYFIYSVKNIITKYRTSKLILHRKQCVVILSCIIALGVIIFLFFALIPAFRVLLTLNIYGFYLDASTENMTFNIYFAFGSAIISIICCVILIKYHVFDSYSFFKTRAVKKATVELHDLRHVFHTIKNYAMVIIALQSKTEKELQNGQKPESLKRIKNTALNLIDQCAEFLDSYSTLNFNIQRTNLVECVTSAILKQEGCNTQFHLEVSTKNTYIYANKAIITEMLSNIIQNSLDAIRAKSENNGEIRIRIMSEINMICVCVYDNGCGMDSSLKKNICKPFFSTKRNFNHWGLGLAYVTSAVKLHSGFLDIKSKKNKFTEIQIAFHSL